MGFIGLPLLVGAADNALMMHRISGWYLSLNRPAGTPPNIVFETVWITLSILMGVAAWLVWQAPFHLKALRLWGWQLALNALWLPAFFLARSPLAATLVIFTQCVLIAFTLEAFWRIDRRAGALLVPYVGCVWYLTYLSVGFWWLN